MHEIKHTATTDMEVTSIRLERELKEKFKELAGRRGYQMKLREVLWEYVRQNSADHRYTPADILSIVVAVSTTEQHCGITGKHISKGETILLGLIRNGNQVVLKQDALTEPSE
jgi:hypothetical protein